MASQRFPVPSVRGFSTPNVPLCGPTFQTGMWRYPLVMPQLPLHPLVEVLLKVRNFSYFQASSYEGFSARPPVPAPTEIRV